MLGEEVVVLSAGTIENPYSGEDEPGWSGTPTETAVTALAVEPRPSGEPVQDARNAVVSGFTLYLPTGTAVTAQNRVRVRGEVYEVIGDPARWRDPFTGFEPGIVVQVQRVEG